MFTGGIFNINCLLNTFCFILAHNWISIIVSLIQHMCVTLLLLSYSRCYRLTLDNTIHIKQKKKEMEKKKKKIKKKKRIQFILSYLLTYFLSYLHFNTLTYIQKQAFYLRAASYLNPPYTLTQVKGRAKH